MSPARRVGRTVLTLMDGRAVALYILCKMENPMGWERTVSQQRRDELEVGRVSLAGCGLAG